MNTFIQNLCPIRKIQLPVEQCCILRGVLRQLFFFVAFAADTKLLMAHPEGFSGIHVTIRDNQIEAALTLHTRDLGTWFPPGEYPDYVADVCRKMEQTIDDIVELRLADEKTPVHSTKAFLLEPGLIEIDVTWSRPRQTEVTELLIWSMQLVRMPRGHQQLLFVEDRRGINDAETPGVMLLEDILTTERDAGVTDLPLSKTADSNSPETDKTATSPTLDDHSKASTDTTGEPEKSQRQPVTPDTVGGKNPTRGIPFFQLGVEHILTGYDHLLFLGALLLVCTTLSQAASIITCFTVAHSITLALAALNVIDLSAGIVEPIIALSIVFVAVENLSEKTPSIRRRVIVTLLFGLIHGLGFASVLKDLGLGRLPGGVLWPLLRFNLGVETGQLIVAAMILPLLSLARRKEHHQRKLVLIGSGLIAVCGGYWLVTRIASQVSELSL